jgi:hypothetical protein
MINGSNKNYLKYKNKWSEKSRQNSDSFIMVSDMVLENFNRLGGIPVRIDVA